jgi:hypothetical protein
MLAHITDDRSSYILVLPSPRVPCYLLTAHHHDGASTVEQLANEHYALKHR